MLPFPPKAPMWFIVLSAEVSGVGIIVAGILGRQWWAIPVGALIAAGAPLLFSRIKQTAEGRRMAEQLEAQQWTATPPTRYWTERREERN